MILEPCRKNFASSLGFTNLFSLLVPDADGTSKPLSGSKKTISSPYSAARASFSQVSRVNVLSAFVLLDRSSGFEKNLALSIQSIGYKATINEENEPDKYRITIELQK